MPKVSIYVSEENMPLYESAKSQLGDSVSSVFVRCLERELEAKRIKAERIVVDVRDRKNDAVRRKAFEGVWLVGRATEGEEYWYAYGDPEEPTGGRYSVARTKANRIAVFEWNEREIVSWRVHENFEDFSTPVYVNGQPAVLYPENLIQAVAAELGIERIEELDI